MLLQRSAITTVHFISCLSKLQSNSWKNDSMATQAFSSTRPWRMCCWTWITGTSRPIYRCTKRSIGQLYRFSFSFFEESVRSNLSVMQLLFWQTWHRSCVVSTATWKSWYVCFLPHMLCPQKLSVQRASQTENLAAQHDDTTASKFCGSLPCPPGSSRFDWHACFDGGIYLEKWDTCVHVWTLTVNWLHHQMISCRNSLQATRLFLRIWCLMFCFTVSGRYGPCIP